MQLQQQQQLPKKEKLSISRRLSRRQRAMEVESIDDDRLTSALRPFNPPPSSTKSKNSNRKRKRKSSSDFVFYNFESDNDDDNDEDYTEDATEHHHNIDDKLPQKKRKKRNCANWKTKSISNEGSIDEEKEVSIAKSEKVKGDNNSVLSPRIVGIVLDGNKCYLSYAQSR